MSLSLRRIADIWLLVEWWVSSLTIEYPRDTKPRRLNVSKTGSPRFDGYAPTRLDWESTHNVLPPEVVRREAMLLPPLEPHGFFNHTDFRSDSSPLFYYRTVVDMDRFLSSLGYLDGDPAIIAPGFALDSHEDSLLVRFGGKSVARYSFTLDESPPQRKHETSRPYLRVIDKTGNETIAKNRDATANDNRGISVGFSDVICGGERYDFWQMKECVQAHREFMRMEANENHAKFTSRIEWRNGDGKALVSEERTFRFLLPPHRAYSLIEMHSVLRAASKDIELKGSPDSAGAHFCPENSEDVTNLQYIFHADAVDPKRDVDLPWVAETILTGRDKCSVIMLNHPTNPKGTHFLANQGGGQLGACPALNISAGESRSLRYQWIFAGGNMLPLNVIEKAAQEFADH